MQNAKAAIRRALCQNVHIVFSRGQSQSLFYSAICLDCFYFWGKKMSHGMKYHVYVFRKISLDVVLTKTFNLVLTTFCIGHWGCFVGVV